MTTGLNKSTFNNLSIALFLLIVLFFPKSDSYFRLYFAALLISSVLLLGSTRKIYFDWLTFIGLGMLLVSAVSIYLRFGFIISPNLRDYTEFGRLMLPVVMLMFRGKFKDLSIKTLFAVFAFYCSIDFLVSILDFSNLDLFGLVDFTNALYVSEYHADVTYRIDGLSAGPGQHGVTMLVLFIFFYIRAFQAKRVLLPLLFSFMCAVPIFLSQSRTSIIAFTLVVFSVPVFYLFFGGESSKKRSFPILTVISGIGIFLFIQFITYFDRVMELARGLGDISSFQKREALYADFFDAAIEHPLFFLIGFGKDFFEISAFDNEYLFLFLIHGPIITSIILGGILFFIIKTLLKKSLYRFPYRIILFFLILNGILIAYPSSFFLELSNIPIILVFINLTYWENKQTNSA